jgi:hypothetical protein
MMAMLRPYTLCLIVPHVTQRAAEDKGPSEFLTNGYMRICHWASSPLKCHASNIHVVIVRLVSIGAEVHSRSSRKLRSVVSLHL